MSNKKFILETIGKILNEVSTEAEVMDNVSKNFATGNVKDILVELSFNKTPDELELYKEGDTDSTSGEFIISFESGDNDCSVDGKFAYYTRMVASPELGVGYQGATENKVVILKLEGFLVEPKTKGQNTMVIEKPEFPDENIVALIDKVTFKQFENKMAELILSKIESDYSV